MRRLLLRLLASAPSAGAHVPDAELLRRFVASNDAAAFDLVVRRHADAVWAAAFRVLRNEADAEDAFQAAFLALLRRSKQVHSASVGGWLHRVAVHAALKLRERAVAAAADLYADPKELRPWLEERVRIAKWNEQVMVARFKVGTIPPDSVHKARYARLKAEIALLKLDRRANGAGGR